MEGSSDSRHFTLSGHDERTDSVIFCNAGHRKLLQHLFVYFGGDVQDEPEAMEKHRDNKRFSEWNLQRTAKLLSENNHAPVLIIKPSRMELGTFASFSNYVRCDAMGNPIHEPLHHALLHLQKIIDALLKTLELSEVNLTLIGFSKGCVVLNQIVHEFHFYSTFSGTETDKFESPWAYQCIEDKCVRLLKSTPHEDFISLDTCKLMCGKGGTLWPLPTGPYKLGDQVVFLKKENIVFRKLASPCSDVDILMEKMMAVLHGYLEKMEEDGLKVTVPHGADTEHKLSLDIYINRCEKQITLQTNESYSLWVNTEGTSTVASIAAETCFGARHGLETLSQLISWDYAFGSLIMQTSATIIDAPAYPHRGLMVDTARNFISFEKLLHIVDGLAHDKMNTLHLHLSDANSFPFDSKRVPQMAKYGAYSPRKVYSFDNLKELGEYANVRGVRIIPEIDAPAHAGNGWQWGSEYGLGNLALCVNESPRSRWACYDPPCGILNPVNNYTYDVLESIYFDLMQALNPDMFHMGGDEVKFNCWNNTNEITEWMTLNGLSRTEEDFFHLWSHFQNTSLQRVDNVFGRDTPVILWTSSLTDQVAVNGHLDPGRYIIQIWSGSRDFTIPRLYYTGYRLIFSNVDAWYLDCGYGSWVGDGLNSCAPYKSWQVMYDNDLDYLMRGFGIRPDPGKILGGEAAMWSEQVDDATIDGKIWPRLSAVAERLWSNLQERWRFAERRFVHHRERMLLKGIMGDAVQPLWCHQNEGFCYN